MEFLLELGAEKAVSTTLVDVGVDDHDIRCSQLPSEYYGRRGASDHRIASRHYWHYSNQDVPHQPDLIAQILDGIKLIV